MGFDGLGDPFLYQRSQLRGLQITVFLPANGLEIVNLDGNGLAALLIQHLEAVHQRHWDDGTFALGGAAEAAAVELPHLVAVPAAGSLREDQIIPPRLYLPDDALNHRQGLAHILPVHGKGLGADGHLMEKGNVVQLLFQHRAHGDVTGCRHGEDIEHTLMVGVKHEPALFGDILRSRYLQIDVAAPYRPFQDVPAFSMKLRNSCWAFPNSTPWPTSTNGRSALFINPAAILTASGSVSGTGT